MLTKRDVANVLACYNLGDLQNLAHACRGYVNETVFIDTDRGRFVLRRNSRRFSKDDQSYRHSLVAWLAEEHLPVPPFIPTRNGETLCEMNGDYYEITPFIHGGDFDFNQMEQVSSVGATLGAYHKAIEGFRRPQQQCAPRYDIHGVLALTEKLLQQDMMGDLQEYLKWYDTRAMEARAILSHTVYQALPQLVIHGDMHRENVLFRGNKVVALIDFDQITWDARLVDLVDALVAFATSTERLPHMMWGMFTGPLDEKRAWSLIEAYARVTPLTEAELAVLPTMLELLWLQGELGRVISTPDGDPAYHQSVLEQGRWLANWISERRESLIAAWTEANAGMHAHAL